MVSIKVLIHAKPDLALSAAVIAVWLLRCCDVPEFCVWVGGCLHGPNPMSPEQVL